MAIRIKVATTAKELQDVYHLRYQVYAEEEGRYGETQTKIVVDQFDAVPNVASVIAYESGIPVGTMRVSLDSEIQLPADETFDFSGYRTTANEQAQAENLPPPLFVNAGMLAIAGKWRNRRDVFRSLFKAGCDVAYAWKATHIIVTASVQSASIYLRLGFEKLEEKVWYEPAGEHIVPMASDLERVYKWAFSALGENNALLDSFADSFEYLLVGKDSSVFTEGEIGHEAYLINKGRVVISRADPASEGQLSLATLGKGDMFGELSLIDDQTRSATATATTNVELIVLTREVFWQKAHEDANYLKSLLSILSNRVRAIDERAFIYAHGSVDNRLKFFLDQVRHEAVPSKKEPNKSVAKITTEGFAYMASAEIEQAQQYLDRLHNKRIIKLSAKSITFYQEPK